jgi:hypothetical protein
VDRDTRVAAGTDGNPDRQRAGRRLCPGAGVHDLQPVQPAAVPRGHGGGAGVLAEPGRSQGAVHQHLGRRGERHRIHPGGCRHHVQSTAATSSASAAAAVAERWRAISRQLAGECGEGQYLHRLGGQRRRGNRGAVFGVQPLHATGTTPVSVNHTGTSVSTSIAFNLPEGESLARRSPPSNAPWREIHMPISIHGSSYGTARLFQQSSSNTPLMLLAALDGDLRGARDAVRELQPAAHHHLDAALGRPRRAAGADGHRHRVQPDRLPGHSAADRHREEERHHDGGLRARGRAHLGLDPRARRSRTPVRCASGRS